jgi:hypothetical protein
MSVIHLPLIASVAFQPYSLSGQAQFRGDDAQISVKADVRAAGPGTAKGRITVEAKRANGPLRTLQMDEVGRHAFFSGRDVFLMGPGQIDGEKPQRGYLTVGLRHVGDPVRKAKVMVSFTPDGTRTRPIRFLGTEVSANFRLVGPPPARPRP